ncbi:phosphotransferase [Allonocardiopsis opalescens]|uniref:Phosphotransferase family enzyme n=1 Tax=Allonocardiopsis opalescens TaxID=1144618 RepID=A0A2T0QEY3_9ACTN|nr:phosphotransferase [Allonocardiopsis opalescens]PRY02478.1 phosphotransferase family enzyme [Allonocardiopsis opalescens]
MDGEHDDGPEVALAGGGRTAVSRRGGTVLRAPGPWSATVVELLRHLEAVGFRGAPRAVGTGFDPATGREALTFIEGGFVHPGPWSEAGAFAVGELLGELHRATASFRVPDRAVWRPWYGRRLGRRPPVIGHCDAGPWNIVAREGLPVAFIDWEAAGPVDPVVELAQVCWLNAQLHDDDVAGRVGLGSPDDRAARLALIADGYRLGAADRAELVDTIITVAVQDAADQAVEAAITPDGGDTAALWGLAWRIRAAAWIQRHRRLLEAALG